MYEAGNGHGFRVHKVGPMWVSGLPMDSPLFCFGMVKINPELFELDKKIVHVLWLELCGNCV